jgi:DNA-3-methyladenine glycosylase I
MPWDLRIPDPPRDAPGHQVHDPQGTFAQSQFTFDAGQLRARRRGCGQTKRATSLPGRARAWTDAFPPAAPADYNSVMSAILHPDGRHRCPWPRQDPLYVAYHDEEWGVPERDDRALYEKLVLDGFQAGLSWITILRKRDNFRRAFDGFAPETVAGYGERKVAALMNDAGIVRNRAKIEGAILSARGYLELMAKGPGFSALLWDFVGGEPQVNHRRSIAEVPAETPVSRAISKELAARGFKFVGPTIIYAFMQAVGMVNDHLVKCYCHPDNNATRGL